MKFERAKQMDTFHITNLVFQIVTFAVVWYVVYFVVEFTWNLIYDFDEYDGLKVYIYKMLLLIPACIIMFWVLIAASVIYCASLFIYSLVGPWPWHTFQYVLSKAEYGDRKLFRRCFIIITMFHEYGGLWFNGGIKTGKENESVRFMQNNGILDEVGAFSGYVKLDSSPKKQEILMECEKMWSNFRNAQLQCLSTFGLFLGLVSFVYFGGPSFITKPLQTIFVNGGMAEYCTMEKGHE